MNHISSLKTNNGRIVTSHEDICRLLKNYYTNIFVADDNISSYPHHENEVRISNE